MIIFICSQQQRNLEFMYLVQEMESAIQFMCQDLGNQERSAWVVTAIHHTVVPLVCYVSVLEEWTLQQQ